MIESICLPCSLEEGCGEGAGWAFVFAMGMEYGVGGMYYRDVGV